MIKATHIMHRVQFISPPGVAGAAAADDDYEDYYKRAHLSSRLTAQNDITINCIGNTN